ncbi:hypothetical protein HaLaN_19552 [Haematococcus lacustris]|uniref:Uncharacterized protein n=1 Tax=Haematococcus lacustris TaxID=44745 RepID=A0A699ZJG0_HAELA|nr:hypothetical protein HaLaN_19552 [Haematococcus lacustris]
MQARVAINCSDTTQRHRLLCQWPELSNRGPPASAYHKVYACTWSALAMSHCSRSSWDGTHRNWGLFTAELTQLVAG